MKNILYLNLLLILFSCNNNHGDIVEYKKEIIERDTVWFNVDSAGNFIDTMKINFPSNKVQLVWDNGILKNIFLGNGHSLLKVSTKYDKRGLIYYSGDVNNEIPAVIGQLDTIHKFFADHTVVEINNLDIDSTVVILKNIIPGVGKRLMGFIDEYYHSDQKFCLKTNNHSDSLKFMFVYQTPNTQIIIRKSQVNPNYIKKDGQNN
jgi:hypothetical protein